MPKTVGVVVGKFYPFHKGHHYLMSEADKMVDQLYIGVCYKDDQDISGEMRAAWIKESFPNAIVKVIDQTKDNIPDSGSEIWAQEAIKLAGQKPDMVFTSEEYGKPWAQAIGCKHVLVDMERASIPISGTMVRENPYKHAKYLDPHVRAYYTKRVCIIGPESTGKSTLAQALSERYNTVWVPEYGRPYSEMRLAEDQWEDSDFLHIAKMQNWWEDNLASQANGLLFCDTNSLTTALFNEWYLPATVKSPVHNLVRENYTLYVYCDPNTPFVQDGMRNEDPLQRNALHEKYLAALENTMVPVLHVHGSVEERIAQVETTLVEILPDTLQRKLRLLPALSEATI